MLSCAMTHSLQRNTPTADIHLPSNGPVETPEVEDVERAVTQMRKISMNGGRDSAYLAEVERDSTGEVTIKGENIQTVYIVAKSKTVAERNGEIAIDFIVGIPAALQSSTWGLSLIPVIENNGMEEALQPLSIRGELFSDIQKRQYWQMNKYLNRILDDSTELTTTTSLAVKYYEAYNRYIAGGQKRRADKLESTYKQTISFPYLNDPRLDSVLIRKGEIRYYYTQTYRPTKDTKRLHLFFRGRVDAIDRSRYDLSNSDTLTYTVTSMLSLLDNEPRYMLKIIDKYVEVRDRNYVTFPVGRATIIDTMGQNRVQLAKIERLMDTLINQYEFFVDSITITASSSPDGSMATNNRIAGERARAIKERLVRKFGHEVDTLIRTRSIGEDWTLLKRLIRHNSDMPNWEQIMAMIDQSSNLDVTEPQGLCIHEGDPLSPVAGRGLPLQPAPRRYGQGYRCIDRARYDLHARSAAAPRPGLCRGAAHPERLQVPEPCDRAALAELRRGGFRDPGAAAAGREEPKNRLPICNSTLAHEPAARRVGVLPQGDSGRPGAEVPR